MLLGAGQADDGRGMSWGGRCGMINADLYRHKRQPSRTSECHKLGPQQSCSRRPDATENRAMPSATHRVSSLWLVAVGKAGRGQVGLLGWHAKATFQKMALIRQRMKARQVYSRQGTSKLLDLCPRPPPPHLPIHSPPSVKTSSWNMMQRLILTEKLTLVRHF